MNHTNKKPRTSADQSAENSSDAAWGDYNTVAKVVGMDRADDYMVASRNTYAPRGLRTELVIPELQEQTIGSVATGTVVSIDVNSVPSEYAVPVTVEHSDVA